MRCRIKWIRHDNRFFCFLDINWLILDCEVMLSFIHPETIIIIIFVIFRFSFLNFILCNIYFFLNRLRLIGKDFLSMVLSMVFLTICFRVSTIGWKCFFKLCLHLFYWFSKRDTFYELNHWFSQSASLSSHDPSASCCYPCCTREGTLRS